MSKTALTVMEEDTAGETYTVVLDSQPMTDVEVTVAGHAGTEVTPNPTTLTFTGSNWETVQPVTVSAGADADTMDGAVTLTHSAGSTDSAYSGITIASVTVTVNDNDRTNTPATGSPTISGTAQVGERLTADTSGIADADGLTTSTYSYQWVANDGTTDTDISDATDAAYTLVDDDEGRTIKVRVTVTDDLGNETTLTSAATEAVEAAPEPPAKPTGLSATDLVPDLSADATLSGLELEDAGGTGITLTLAFDPATYVYTASVAYNVDSVTLRATKNHAAASVAVLTESGSSTPDEATVDLAVGGDNPIRAINPISAIVTSEDGTVSLIYMVTVTRSGPEWSATLTVGTEEGMVPAATGYSMFGLQSDGLSSDEFTYEGKSYSVFALLYLEGGLYLVSNHELPSDFTLWIGDSEYDGSDSLVIPGS